MSTLLSLALSGAVAHAGPTALVGVDWVPSGRGDLAWVDDGQGSGTLVGEFDGLLRPPVTAWGGPAWAKDAVLFGLGATRWSTTTWTADQKTHISMGSIRPSVDYRRYFRERTPGKATAWVGAGVHGNIPLVAMRSEAWTEEERVAMEETAATERARIGGFGGRAGLGAELWLPGGVGLGARWSATLHHQQWNGTDGYTVSSWLGSEAALTLALRL